MRKKGAINFSACRGRRARPCCGNVGEMVCYTNRANVVIACGEREEVEEEARCISRGKCAGDFFSSTSFLSVGNFN